MGIPKKVAEQAKLADEMAKQLLGQDQPQAVPPVGNTQAAAPQDVNNQQNAAPQAQVVEPAVAPQAPQGETTPAPPQAPQAAPCPECAKWEQRYRVLQGKYDAEVPRLTYRIAFLENQIEDLKKNNQQVANNQTQAAPDVNVQATSLADILRNSNDDRLKSFRENFPDIFDFVVLAVDQVANNTKKAIEEKLASIEQVSVKNLEEKFWREIQSAVPDWQTICNDNSNIWAEWLLKKDRYSPKRRLDLLKEAQAAFDSQAVINMLNDFKKEMGMGGGNPVASPQTNNPAPNQTTRPQQVVMPPSGPASVPSSSGQAEFITRSFINQFYQDKARGRFYGREKLMNEIEAKINKAVMEGRVVEG